MKFKYKFQIVGDGKYGNVNAHTGEWNGMIRELQDQVITWAVSLNRRKYYNLQSTLVLKVADKRLGFYELIKSFATNLSKDSIKTF